MSNKPNSPSRVPHVKILTTHVKLAEAAATANGPIRMDPESRA